MTSPFAEAQARLKPSFWARVSAWRVPLVFSLCLIVGLAAVAWRASIRAETARAIARTEARACGASIELQLSQASAAAEILGALAKQGTGGFTNFQRVATELLAAHPSLASLQLEPGGVIRDIVPRAGNERALGINVLKDAGQRATANESMARHVLTVVGPVPLDRGTLGIVAREPVFQRTPDGRESFWGFIAASMRLQEALSRAHVDDLVRQGYDLAFFAPASGQQKAVGIASHGLSLLRDSVQQPARIQNLEFRLALRPRGGWIDKTKVALESLAVLLLSSLVAICVNLVISRRAMEVDLTGTTRRLVHEAADRTQAQADYRGAKEKLETAQGELQQTQLALQKAKSDLAQVPPKPDGDVAAREEAARVNQAELKEAHAALQKAQETIAQLQARLEEAAQAKDAAQQRLERDQSRISELELRLEAAIKAGRQTADASAARLAQLEESNREFKARLAVADRAEARVTELNALLQEAHEELKHRQETSTRSADEARTKFDEAVGAEPASNGSGGKPSAEEFKPQSPAPASPVVKVAVSQPGPRIAEASVGPDSPKSPPVTQDGPKAPKRKKARRDDQLSLFGNEMSPVTADKRTAAEAAARVAEAKQSKTTEELTSVATQPNPPVESSKEKEPAPSRHLPAAPPIDPTQLRKAVSQIVPLLAERDPGAKDCLRDNRKTFRSAFAPEAYVEFEELVKNGDSDTALEHLKKAVRKHGISA